MNTLELSFLTDGESRAGRSGQTHKHQSASLAGGTFPTTPDPDDEPAAQSAMALPRQSPMQDPIGSHVGTQPLSFAEEQWGFAKNRSVSDMRSEGGTGTIAGPPGGPIIP